MNRRGFGLMTVIMAAITVMMAIVLAGPIQDIGDSVIASSNISGNPTAHLIINLFPFFFLVMVLWGIFALAQNSLFQRNLGG